MEKNQKVKKVVFPLEILPASSVGAAFFHFIITLGLVFIGALLVQAPLTLSVFWLPVILLPLAAIAVGCSLLLSALGVFWRDISQITQFFVLALMFASAVFYPISQIPPTVWIFLRFNPFLHAINEARNVVFWGQQPNGAHIVYLYACGLVAVASFNASAATSLTCCNPLSDYNFKVKAIRDTVRIRGSQLSNSV